MAANPFTPNFASLPATLPVFPLSGVALLPLSEMQLNIFEPRYLNMISDALGAGRMIGIVQPNTSTTPGKNVLYQTGCAGRITIFNEASDGRFLINLLGVCRFDISSEVATIRGDRRIAADWQLFKNDLLEEEAAIETAPLLKLLYNYFEFNNIQADLDALREMPGPRLINSLAIHLPFAPEEKQVLVEALNLPDRMERIMALAKMSLATRLSSRPTRH
jgi:Lon protease-like protein